MLYPTNMDQHGPSRSLEEYLYYLYDELEAEEPRSPRARDMLVRILWIEEEINARGDL